jgi:PAS domain S-box-containing protein
MTPVDSTSELEERERLYHTVFDASPDAIFIEDLDGNVLEANPAACRLHGLTHSQLIGRNVADLVPAEHRDKVVGQLQLVEGDVESVSLGVDGTKIPVSIRSSAIMYLGRPAILLHVRDITARRNAETAMHESQEHYKLLFNSHPQPMWVHDLETLRFISVNHAAQRLYKYSINEFIAMESISTIVVDGPADDVDLLTLPNIVKVATAKHRRKDGLALEVELIQHTISFNGRCAAFVMINRVISTAR